MTELVQKAEDQSFLFGLTASQQQVDQRREGKADETYSV
jgi:hypothetical protein